MKAYCPTNSPFRPAAKKKLLQSASFPSALGWETVKVWLSKSGHLGLQLLDCLPETLTGCAGGLGGATQESLQLAFDSN